MTQRIVVVGEGGEGEYVGRRVAEALRPSDWATPELVDFDAVGGALAGTSGVVMCVTGSIESIVRSADLLAAAAVGRPEPPRIVYISSQTVYGEASGEVDERAPAAGALSPYGAAKTAAERAVARAHAVVLRPGIIYGPGSAQWSGRVAQWLAHRRIGDLGRNGDGRCNLVFIDDLVEAVVRALRLPGVQGRVFNLSLPAPPTWNEYFIRYAKALGTVPVRRVTQRRLSVETKLWAPPLKILQLLAGRVAPGLQAAIPEPIPPSSLRAFQQDIRLSVRAAESDLKMTWSDLSAGLAATARTYGKART